MSRLDDLDGDMHHSPLDDQLIERLLSNRVEPEDAPPEVAHLARLLRSASAPAQAGELAGEERIVASMAAAVLSATSLTAPDAPPTRKSMIARLFTAKVAALAAAATIMGATGAAAATGKLPAPAQTSVASAFSHVGVDLPKPADDNGPGHGAEPAGDKHGHPAVNDDTTSTTAGADDPGVHHEAEPGDDHGTDTTTVGRGPDATGTAASGLCTAAHVSGDDSTTSTSLDKSSVPFKNLADAAAKAGMTVEAYCKTLTAGRSASSGPGSSNSGPGAANNVNGDNSQRGGSESGDDHGNDGKVTTTTTAATPTSSTSSPSTTSTTEDNHGSSNSGRDGSGSGSGSSGNGSSNSNDSGKSSSHS